MRAKLLFWLIDVKTAARKVIAQCEELHIDLSDNATAFDGRDYSDGDDDDDFEWEEQEDKPGFEETVGDLEPKLPARPPMSEKERRAAEAAGAMATANPSDSRTSSTSSAKRKHEDGPKPFVPAFMQK